MTCSARLPVDLVGGWRVHPLVDHGGDLSAGFLGVGNGSNGVAAPLHGWGMGR